ALPGSRGRGAEGRALRDEAAHLPGPRRLPALFPMARGETVSRDRIAVFRRLHETGCFVMPNPWDVGSARVLAQLGFPALATTSAGFAWSIGLPDNRVRLDHVLDHCRAIASAVDVPVNADFEGAFAIEPAGVATNVAKAAATGVAG